MDKEKIDLERILDQIEKRMLSNALLQADGIINKVAKQLNLSFIHAIPNTKISVKREIKK